MSDLQRVESDTARVSVLLVAGCKFPAVFLGKVALDVIGLGVGPPCLRVDSEETLLTLMDERAQLVRAAPGVTPVDRSEEGAPVQELIGHSVLGKPLVDSLQEPMPVMKRLEHAIQATASVWEPLEHVHCVVTGYVNFDSFWMAPWDAGGTHGDGWWLCVTFWRILLQSMIWLSCRYASDLLATMSTDLRQMDGILDVIGAVKIDCRTVWGFPQIDSAVVDCGAVELDDLNFRWTSFPPDEYSAGREGDYIWLAPLVGLSVRARSVTESLPFGSPHRLVRSCLCLAALSFRWIVSADVPLCHHLVSAYFLPPCFTRILTICCCFNKFFKERNIASGRSPDRDQVDPFYAQARSARLYDFASDIQDAMELRALGPNAKLVMVMSVWNSRCIRVMTPDDLVACGFHEILLHDMGEEELSFMAKSELDYIRRVWLRAFFAFLTRYQQDLKHKRKECKVQVGCTQSENCTYGGKYIQMDFGKYIAFCHLELAWQCYCLVV